MSARRPLALLTALALVVTACSGPILANEPLDFPTPPVPTERPAAPPDPIPVAFPRDDGPHDRLTEWWYYTGHLRTAEGRPFGFEAVIFRAERGSLPTGWTAHLALTDEAGTKFHYAQRFEVGAQVDRSPRAPDGQPTGFDLGIRGLNPEVLGGSGLGGAGPIALAGEPWRLAGANGVDQIEAALTPEEAAAAGASFGLRLDLSAVKAPALHDGDGFLSFGPAGSSYYYSRTRLEATGELELDGERFDVEGIAWFDHQWGDYISVGGGWDWFAINLDDGSDLTFSLVRDAQERVVLAYGTRVDPTGVVTHLDADAFEVDEGSTWTSERSGVTYPGGWTILTGDLRIDLKPTVADQELDTRATTGVIYWEGSQEVDASRNGVPLGGEAYVEITRYRAP